MSQSFVHREITELLWKARVFQDARGERVTWATWWLVYDAEASEDRGWFAIVRKAWRDGAERMVCEVCDDTECPHIRRIVEDRQDRTLAGDRAGRRGEERVDPRVFCD